jgi:small subunit ribosomal protein S2
MVQPTGAPSAPSPDGVPPPSAETSGGAVAERPSHAPPTLRALLEAGCHFGHQTRRWDPRMKPFIYGERNGIHIIDLDQTLQALLSGLDFLRETVANGGKVLFVGTKRQAQAPVRLEAERSSQFFATNRWLGGMLTNFRTVKKSIERFKERLAQLEDEEKLAELSKKDRARLNREITRYRKALDGIREMTRLPEALFVIDVARERIAVSEARRLGIPIVAVVDTNCSPEGIEHVIPGNDDAIRAIQLYCSCAADACLEGQLLFDERVQAQPEAVAAAEVERPAAPSTGRVVVEITQPPRRGARGGTRSAGGRREAEREEAEPARPAEP